MKRTIKLVDGVAYTALALAMAGAFTLFYGSQAGTSSDCLEVNARYGFMKVTDVPKRKSCICTELAEVVREQAELGTITTEQAERLAQKCWRTEF